MPAYYRAPFVHQAETLGGYQEVICTTEHTRDASCLRTYIDERVGLLWDLCPPPFDELLVSIRFPEPPDIPRAWNGTILWVTCRGGEYAHLLAHGGVVWVCLGSTIPFTILE